MLKQPIKLGILGCGSFVQRRILPILKTLSSFSVIAIQKRNSQEAKQIALKYNIPKTVSTREELLNLNEIETVLVATTNHMHEDDVLACAKYS
jgi:predicted dehydrogenase